MLMHLIGKSPNDLYGRYQTAVFRYLVYLGGIYILHLTDVVVYSIVLCVSLFPRFDLAYVNARARVRA